MVENDNNSVSNLYSFEVNKDYAIYLLTYSCFADKLFAKIDIIGVDREKILGIIKLENDKVSIKLYDDYGKSELYINDFISIINNLKTNNYGFRI